MVGYVQYVKKSKLSSVYYNYFFAYMDLIFTKSLRYIVPLAIKMQKLFKRARKQESR